MDRLDAMRLFVRAVESGSFAAAAREAGIGQPAVSKQIAALERRLGVQLLRRTSRSMMLTDGGQTFYESAVRLLEEFDAAEALVSRGQSLPSGLVRMSVAPVFGRVCIVPRLPEFFARYPDVSIELSGSERPVHLIEEGIDLAIRVGAVSDSSMTVRKLAAAPFITVATPAYLDRHGVPQSPGELNGHTGIIFLQHGEPRLWQFGGKPGPADHQAQGNFRTGDAEQIRAAVLADLGVSHGPAYLYIDDVASGALRLLLADFAPEPLAVSAVHPAGRRVPAKVRVLIDFLVEILPNSPGLRPG